MHVHDVCSKFASCLLRHVNILLLNAPLPVVCINFGIEYTHVLCCQNLASCSTVITVFLLFPKSNSCNIFTVF